MKFTEILQELNIPYKESGDKHCTPGFINITCPWCLGHCHLGYNLSKNYFNCWKCGSKRTIEVLQYITNKSYEECKDLIGNLQSYIPKNEKVIRKLVIPEGVKPIGLAHYNYLKSRKLDPIEICTLWKVQGIGMNNKLQWRLFIPIVYKGEVCSWTTRSISNEVSNRYISAPLGGEKLEHKKLLYGEDFCRNCIVICEGVFDAWRIGPGAVATFGTSYSKAQVLKMVKYPVRVVLFDKDAKSKAKELAELLSVYSGQTHNIILDSKDPGEASDSDIKLIRKLYLD